MRVISCQVRDEVRVGESVRITVLEVADDRIVLGITSPSQFPEYQEQVIYLTDESDEEAGGYIEADRHLVEI